MPRTAFGKSYFLATAEFGLSLTAMRNASTAWSIGDDEAALAAIDLAPEGTAVLYGMPDAGVVLVWADARAKAGVRDLIARMV